MAAAGKRGGEGRRGRRNGGSEATDKEEGGGGEKKLAGVPPAARRVAPSISGGSRRRKRAVFLATPLSPRPARRRSLAAERMTGAVHWAEAAPFKCRSRARQAKGGGEMWRAPAGGGWGGELESGACAVAPAWPPVSHVIFWPGASLFWFRPAVLFPSRSAGTVGSGWVG